MFTYASWANTQESSSTISVELSVCNYSERWFSNFPPSFPGNSFGGENEGDTVGGVHLARATLAICSLRRWYLLITITLLEDLFELFAVGPGKGLLMSGTAKRNTLMLPSFGIPPQVTFIPIQQLSTLIVY